MNSSTQKQTICEHFARTGYCKFGRNCMKSHDVSKIRNLNRNENMHTKPNNASNKPIQNKFPQNEYNNKANAQKPIASVAKNKIEEEKIIIKKDLCDNFRKGTCSVENCRRLHQFSPSGDLKLIGSELLTQNNQEKSLALVEIAFPVFAVCFTRRIMIFDANDSAKKVEIAVDGDLSCLKLQGKLLVAAYTDADKKGHLLIIPVTEGFPTKVDIPNCHQNEITSMVFFDNKILTASLDGYLKLWDEDKVKKQIVAVAYGMATTGITRVIKVEQSNGKLYIIAGCVDGTIQFFEWIKETIGIVPQFDRKAVLPAHKGAIMSMLVFNGLLYSGGYDSNICIVSIATPATPKIITHQKINGPISTLEYLKKSNKILIGYTTGLVQIYKADGFVEDTWFGLHKSMIVDVASIEDNNIFFVIDYNSFITTWQIQEQVAILPNTGGQPATLEEFKMEDLAMNRP